jgi:signal transduction histidine kinase
LSVLSSSAVVVDSEDRVLRASAAARAFGIVKGDRLMVGELLALARQVRRDGEIRDTEIEVQAPGHAGRSTSFAVRVAPLSGAVGGGGLVLVLAEDQTESRRVEEVEALDRCRMKANARGITLSSSGVRGLTVLGAEDLLVTAVRNLLENAVVYSPERTNVVVAVRRPGDGGVEVSVIDQGIGIPERDLERIFERFYRVDPARSRATGGTGLGLAIVKHVMAAHGGRVTVRSVEGEGSTFTLWIPLRQEAVQ